MSNTPVPLNLVPMGKLLKPRGLNGELRVSFFNEENSALKKGVKIWLKANEFISHKIETIVMADKKSCIKFKDCNTRDEANVLQGLMIYLPRNAFNFIATNEHYLIDIMESKVVNEDQKHIGMVTDVLSIFSQNIIEVKIGKNEVLVPYVDDYVKFFDKESKILILKDISELIN